MKKLIISNFFVLVALFSSNISIAQDHSHNGHTHGHENDPAYVSEADIQALTDFDEKPIIDELKKNKIPESEFSGFIRGKKIQYILEKRGVSTKAIYENSEKLKSAGPCDNAGFEFLNFNNWTGQSGTVSSTGTPTWSGGIANLGNNSAVTLQNAQQTIMTTPPGTPPTGYDPNARNGVTGLYEIPVVAPGGSPASVRLGNAYALYGTEKLSYQIAVTPSNTSFTYQYAVVLESPTGHSSIQQPKFQIRVYDQNGVQVTGPCGFYSVEGLAAATDTTFKPYYNSYSSTGQGIGTPRGYYKKWTTVGIDLTPYINTNVTIEFQTIDCTLGGHYGYAYIDAGCSILQATVDFCPNDTLLVLTAPPAYNGYQWYDNNNNPIPAPNGTNDTLFVQNPILGQSYTVSMLSASGCGSSLVVNLNYSQLSYNQSSTNVKCWGDNDGSALISNVTGASGPYTYSWVDSASGQVVSTNDSLNAAVAGTYYVTVWSKGGCSVTDTIVITQPANQGDTTNVDFAFCPGDNEVILYAPQIPGAIAYTWYAGPNSNGAIIGTGDSIHIYNPQPGYQYTLEVTMPSPTCALFVTTTLNYQPPPAMPDYSVKTNVFSPNGDGFNDYFDLSNYKFVKDFKIEIFNRWGKRVFASYDMSFHWDGKIDGNVAEDGVYFWIAHYTESCHENPPVVKSTGFVHVVR